MIILIPFELFKAGCGRVKGTVTPLIQYSTSGKFTGVKSAWVTKNTVLSKKITNLTKGKKYYVRMRTIITVGGVKH